MWFTASLLFKSLHDSDVAVASLWEEVIVLVEADDEARARSIAEQIGESRRHEYEVSIPTAHLVRWAFVQVERIHPVEDRQPRSGSVLSQRAGLLSPRAT